METTPTTATILAQLTSHANKYAATFGDLDESDIEAIQSYEGLLVEDDILDCVVVWHNVEFDIIVVWAGNDDDYGMELLVEARVVRDTVATILVQCIEDITAESVNGPIRIYGDPNGGGLAWDRWSDDLGNCESGPIGPELAAYGEDAHLLDAVKAELADAGYTVLS